jgi:NADH-quinone oxidoreductase subunit F
MLEILTGICEGRGKEDDIETLEKWADIISKTALCGLGQTAPNPVLSTLRYFRDEYEAHIREKRCPAAVCSSLFKSPCQHTCPVGMDVPSYVALIKAGRLEDAYKVLLQTNPFPSICGRVCDHKCEMKCRRATLDEPVSIKFLKRYVTDNASRPAVEQVPVTRKEKVAVIGAGPSGLTAARDLALRGYAVTVFEELPEAGGMLRWGIPEYRLPRTIINAEIQDILDLGVELRCSTQVGKEIPWDKVRKDFDAVYIAIGAQKSFRMGVQGEELEGVSGAVEFLRAVNLGQKTYVGKRVTVVGGGNSAIDAARSALRLGAEDVTILYRRLRPDMPAQEEEIHAAEEEGVKIEYLIAPVRFQGDNGKVQKVICQKMTLGDFDSSGRRRPVPSIGDEMILDVDHALIAIGQEVIYPAGMHKTDVQVIKGGLVEVVKGKKTQTGAPMIFAGGDVVTGPDTVIGAIAAGHKAASEIDEAFRQKNGEAPYVPPQEQVIEVPVAIEEEIQEMARTLVPEIAVSKRIKNFTEVELGFPHGDAVREAGRCLRCDIKLG